MPAPPALQRWIRWVFLTNAAITPLFAITYFAPVYPVPIQLLGGIPWSITVPACLVMLALYFRQRMSTDATAIADPSAVEEVQSGRSEAD